MKKKLANEFRRQRARFEEAVELVTVYLRHLMRYRELVPLEEIPVRISGRVKSESSIAAKLAKIQRGRTRKANSLARLMELMDDVAGVRIICDYLDDVAVTYQYLVKHRAFRVLQHKTQDYVAHPRDGYRAIHTVIEVRTSFGKTKCEV